MSVIARQMNTIRDDFIAELFAEMKAEIRGLNHDARMMDLWRASLTENVVAAIHYLDRDSPAPSTEAPAAALAYARASAQRDVQLSALVRAHRIGLARFLEVAIQYASSLEPAQRVPTIIELVNRSARFADLVADQLTVAYEQEHDRWVSRRGGLELRWVSEVLAGGPVDVKRAEKALRYRLDDLHLAAVLWVDAAVASRDVLVLFDEARSSVAAELAAAGRSLMRCRPMSAKLGCGFWSGYLVRSGLLFGCECARRSSPRESGRAWHAVVWKTAYAGSGILETSRTSEGSSLCRR